MEKYTTLWVAVSVEECNGRGIAEGFEDSKYDDIPQFIATSTQHGEIKPSDILIYQRSGFVDALNSQDLDIENYWVSYINVENIEPQLLCA